jgi:hypothetical protein
VTRLSILALATLLITGCWRAGWTGERTDGGDGSDTDVDLDSDSDSDSGSDTDTDWEPPEDSNVFAQTIVDLYMVAPSQGGQLQHIGAFDGPCTEGTGLYDIAVDEDLQMIGITSEGLFWIDAETAECGVLVDFPADYPQYYSLSYVKGVDPDAPSEDRLVAASGDDGAWVLIDPAGTTVDDTFVHLGYFDPVDQDLRSSGDIVSVRTGDDEYQTYATVRCGDMGYSTPGCESDILVRVDPQTGLAEEIGATGFQSVLGLGFWGDEVYGFTGNGQYLTIDTGSGQGTLVTLHPGEIFWGAGTTTEPFIASD